MRGKVREVSSRRGACKGHSGWHGRAQEIIITVGRGLALEGAGGHGRAREGAGGRGRAQEGAGGRVRARKGAGGRRRTQEGVGMCGRPL